MNPIEARQFFPHIREGLIYFNHASVSPLSSLVVDSAQQYLHRRSVTAIDDYSVVEQSILDAKKKLSTIINCDEDRIAFFDNTSNGLNVIAQGIQWKSGDRIILNDIEFPSNVYPFLNLKPLGVEVDFVKSKNGIVSADEIIAAITPRTRMISISYVQFLSGYRADLQAIGEVCKQKDILFTVDAIQGLGAVQLDVKQCHIDFLACGTQKWMMGLMGLAFVFITEELQEHISPKYVGWQSVEDEWTLLNYDLVLKKTANALQNGTISAIGVSGFNAALDLFLKVGTQQVEDAVLHNARLLSERLQELGYDPVLKHMPKRHQSGIVSFHSPDAKRLFQKLMHNNVRCSLREGYVRLSPHFYNSDDEIETAINIIKTRM